jgi:hypothetical protein
MEYEGSIINSRLIPSYELVIPSYELVKRLAFLFSIVLAGQVGSKLATSLQQAS